MVLMVFYDAIRHICVSTEGDNNIWKIVSVAVLPPVMVPAMFPGEN